MKKTNSPSKKHKVFDQRASTITMIALNTLPTGLLILSFALIDKDLSKAFHEVIEWWGGNMYMALIPIFYIMLKRRYWNWHEVTRQWGVIAYAIPLSIVFWIALFLIFLDCSTIVYVMCKPILPWIMLLIYDLITHGRH